MFFCGKMLLISVVRFPNPLAPGSDLQMCISIGEPYCISVNSFNLSWPAEDDWFPVCGIGAKRILELGHKTIKSEAKKLISITLSIHTSSSRDALDFKRVEVFYFSEPFRLHWECQTTSTSGTMWATRASLVTSSSSLSSDRTESWGWHLTQICFWSNELPKMQAK